MEYATMLKTSDSKAGGYVVELDGKAWEGTDRADTQTCVPCGRCGGRSFVNGVLILLTLISFSAHFLQFLQTSRLEERLLLQQKQINDMRTDTYINSFVHEADDLPKNTGADNVRTERSGSEAVPHFYLRGGDDLENAGNDKVFLWANNRSQNNDFYLISPNFIPVNGSGGLIKELIVQKSGVYKVFGKVTVRGRQHYNIMAPPAVTVALKRTQQGGPSVILTQEYLTQDKMGNHYGGVDRYPVDSIHFQGLFLLYVSDRLSVEITNLANRQFNFLNGPLHADFGAHIVEEASSNNRR